ncbi:type II secretion system protein [Paraburkholderia sp. SIMBA_049]
MAIRLIVGAVAHRVVTLTAPSFVAWRVRDQVDARVTVCRVDAAWRCLAAGQSCKTGVIDWSCGWAVMIERGGGFYQLRTQPDLAPVSIVGALTSAAFGERPDGRGRVRHVDTRRDRLKVEQKRSER